MRKTFRQILQKRSDLDLSSSTFDELIEIMQYVRENTIQECILKGYGVYYEDETPIYVNIRPHSIAELEKYSLKVL